MKRCLCLALLMLAIAAVTASASAANEVDLYLPFENEAIIAGIRSSETRTSWL